MQAVSKVGFKLDWVNKIFDFDINTSGFKSKIVTQIMEHVSIILKEGLLIICLSFFQETELTRLSVGIEPEFKLI